MFSMIVILDKNFFEISIQILPSITYNVHDFILNLKYLALSEPHTTAVSVSIT